MTFAKCQPVDGVSPELLVALAAALAAFGYPLEDGYCISSVVKSDNCVWRKAGILENMLGRELNREYM